MRPLSPFRINTSKKSWRSSIAFIPNDFNSTRINTSVILDCNSPRINTSKKHGVGVYGTFSRVFSLRISAAGFVAQAFLPVRGRFLAVWKSPVIGEGTQPGVAVLHKKAADNQHWAPASNGLGANTP